MYKTTLPEKFFPAHIVQWTIGDPTFDVDVFGFDGNIVFERTGTNWYSLIDEFEELEESDSKYWLLDIFIYLTHEINYDEVEWVDTGLGVGVTDLSIKVYFEIGPHKDAYLAATFDDEELYHACLPALERLCAERGYNYITESID